MTRARAAFLLIALPFLFGLAVHSSAASVTEYPLPGRLTFPSAIVFTADGRGWISTLSGGILRVNLDGSITKVVNESRSYRDLVVGPDGAVWTTWGGELLRIDPVSSAMQVVSSGEYINGLATGPDGALWLLRRDSSHIHHVVRLNPAGLVLSTVTTNLRIFDGIRPTAIAPDGTMWTLYGDGVVRVNAAGDTSTFPLSFWGNWIFAGPDSLWVVGDDLRSVARIGLAGEVLMQHRFSTWFVGANVDADANLWLIEDKTGSLIRISQLGVHTRYGPLPDRPADARCENGIPVPISFTPDGRVAVIKWFFEDNNYSPYGVCRADPRGTDSLFFVEPAQHPAFEIPTLSPLDLAALAILIALAGASRILGS